MSNFVSTFRTKTLFVCSRQLSTNDPINNLESIDVRSFDLSHFLLFVIEIKLTFVFISKSILMHSLFLMVEVLPDGKQQEPIFLKSFLKYRRVLVKYLEVPVQYD